MLDISPSSYGGYGSAGGGGDNGGGGGGRIVLVTQNYLWINGSVLSEGQSSNSTDININTVSGGAGSGGSIAIIAGKIKGIGICSVAGGSSVANFNFSNGAGGFSNGAGGGGRISLRLLQSSNFERKEHQVKFYYSGGDSIFFNSEVVDDDIYNYNVIVIINTSPCIVGGAGTFFLELATHKSAIISSSNNGLNTYAATVLESSEFLNGDVIGLNFTGRAVLTTPSALESD